MGLKEIPDGLFECCSHLTEAVIPEGVTRIFPRAFTHCIMLSRVSVPEGVEDIGYMQFAWCSSLLEITIPNSVKTLGGLAFSECKSLVSARLPQRMERVGVTPFTGCRSLKEINSTAVDGKLIGLGELGIYSATGLDYWFTQPDGLNGIKDEDAIRAAIRGFLFKKSCGELSEEAVLAWVKYISDNTEKCLKIVADEPSLYLLATDNKLISDEDAERLAEITPSLECRAILLEYCRRSRRRACAPV